MCFITDILLLTHYVVLLKVTVFTVGGKLQKLQLVSNPSLSASVVIYGSFLIRRYKTVLRIHGAGCH